MRQESFRVRVRSLDAFGKMCVNIWLRQDVCKYLGNQWEKRFTASSSV